MASPMQVPMAPIVRAIVLGLSHPVLDFMEVLSMVPEVPEFCIPEERYQFA